MNALHPPAPNTLAARPGRIGLAPSPALAVLALTLGLLLPHAAARAASAPAVRWSAAQIQASDLGVSRLTPALYRQTFAASATVENPASLVQGLGALAVAQAQLAAAQSAQHLAQGQAQRALGLFQAGQDVALATVQQAQAQTEQAQAQVTAAQAAEQTAQATLQIHLGAAVAARLLHDASLRQAVTQGRDVLVALTLPPGVLLPTAPHIALQPPGGADAPGDGWIAAQLLGPAATASAQMQGLREMLVVPARAGLMPGLHLAARVDASRGVTGVLLPAASVVWAQGQAVVFTAEPSADGGQIFTPRPVSTAWPLHGGYVQPGWGPLAAITRGAGLVLTPPPLPHAQPAPGGDDD